MQRLILTNIVLIVISFPIVRDTTEWLGFSLIGYLYYPLIPLFFLHVCCGHHRLTRDPLTRNKLLLILVITCCFVVSAWFSRSVVEFEASCKRIIPLFFFSSSFLILQLSRARVIWLLKVFFLSSVAGSIIIISSYARGNMIHGALRGTMIGGDANESAIFMSIACVIGLFLNQTNRSAMYRLMILLPVAGCVFTASRTGFVALSATFILYIAFEVSVDSRKVMAVILPVLCVLIVLYCVGSDIALRLVTITEEVRDKSVGDRVGIWEKGVEIFADSPVYGNGFDTFTSWYEYYYSTDGMRSRNAHNVFLKVLAELGIIGELVLIIIMGKILYSAQRLSNRKETFLLWGIFSTVLISFVTLSWIYCPSTWFFLLALSRLEDLDCPAAENCTVPVYMYVLPHTQNL